jgi:hypothetical protein
MHVYIIELHLRRPFLMPRPTCISSDSERISRLLVVLQHWHGFEGKLGAMDLCVSIFEQLRSALIVYRKAQEGSEFAQCFTDCFSRNAIGAFAYVHFKFSRGYRRSTAKFLSSDHLVSQAYRLP